jgi:hypothetical protein
MRLLVTLAACVMPAHRAAGRSDDGALRRMVDR